MSLAFEWDPRKDRSNNRKHGVSFAEAVSVFSNPLARIFPDEGRSAEESREIFLYDTPPGGAVVASQLVECGGELFQRALKLMRTCPENCDASCYRCLRSFKNKFEHGLLDRHVGAYLVE